jgi:hypothetical protein
MCADAERTITKYGDRVEKSIVDKVRRAIDNVKESLAKDETDELKSQVAGLDVALLDFGRVIHTAKPTLRDTKAKKRPTVETIELGGLKDGESETIGNGKPTGNELLDDSNSA